MYFPCIQSVDTTIFHCFPGMDTIRNRHEKYLQHCHCSVVSLRSRFWCSEQSDFVSESRKEERTVVRHPCPQKTHDANRNKREEAKSKGNKQRERHWQCWWKIELYCFYSRVVCREPKISTTSTHSTRPASMRNGSSTPGAPASAVLTRWQRLHLKRRRPNLLHNST